MKKMLWALLIALPSQERTIPVQIGDNICELKFHDNQSSVATAVCLHSNETTAITALKEMETDARFNILEIRNGGERNIKFSMQSRLYAIDPNRIFSRKGVQLTLNERNENLPTIPNRVTRTVRRFGKKLVSEIKQRKVGNYILTAHNNSDGNCADCVSVVNYANRAHNSSRDIAAVAIFEERDEDDFVLVTEEEDFMFFKANRANVVLYKNSVVDDGSLSVYCVQNKIPYINVEAQHGHVKEQKEMLKLTYQLLSTKKNRIQ